LAANKRRACVDSALLERDSHFCAADGTQAARHDDHRYEYDGNDDDDDANSAHGGDAGGVALTCGDTWQKPPQLASAFADEVRQDMFRCMRFANAWKHGRISPNLDDDNVAATYVRDHGP
jgi:hypothetical protein